MSFEKLRTVARVAEVTAIFGKIEDIGKKAATLENDALFNENLSTVVGMKNKAVTAINRSKTASNLEELDIERDKATHDAFQLCHGYEAHPSDKIKAAALKISGIFCRHANVWAESYARQTTITESMLEETDAAKDDVESLDGLSELLKKVRSANDAFKARSTELNALQVASADDACASKLKKEMLLFLNTEFLPYLSMMSKKGGDYKSAFDEIENEIKKLNAAISQRSKK